MQNQVGINIYIKIKEVLITNGFNPNKCMGIGTDGAYNMTGRKKGVYACFHNENPFLTNVHCASHRLALAAGDTSKQLGFLKEYIEDISSIYAFFSRSAKRNTMLKKYQLETCEPHLHVLRMCATRWLSLSHCVKNLRRTYGAIILSITEEFNEIIPNSEQAKKEEERLRILLSRISNYKFIAFTHYLSDILQIIENLSLQFQKDNINYASLFKAIDICINEIKENYIQKQIYGENYKLFCKEFEQNTYLPSIIIEFTPILETEVNENMKNFARYYLENIKDRFAHQDIVLWLQILDISNILEIDEEKYVDYGRDELENLIEFYGIDKKVNNVTNSALIDANATRGEYRLFKRMIRSNCKKMTNDEFWIHMCNENQRSLYPNMYKLGMIANILPISTAICERGFSIMNLIKNDIRSCLGNYSSNNP